MTNELNGSCIFNFLMSPLTVCFGNKDEEVTLPREKSLKAELADYFEVDADAFVVYHFLEIWDDDLHAEALAKASSADPLMLTVVPIRWNHALIQHEGHYCCQISLHMYGLPEIPKALDFEPWIQRHWRNIPVAVSVDQRNFVNCSNITNITFQKIFRKETPYKTFRIHPHWLLDGEL